MTIFLSSFFRKSLRVPILSLSDESLDINDDLKLLILFANVFLSPSVILKLWPLRLILLRSPEPDKLSEEVAADYRSLVLISYVRV